MRTAREVAEHYRPGAALAGDYFKIKCPYHKGNDNNLSIGDAPDGGLILKCWSKGCSFNEILGAFQKDGLTVHREWTYPNGKRHLGMTKGASKRTGRLKRRKP